MYFHDTDNHNVIVTSEEKNKEKIITQKTKEWEQKTIRTLRW